MQTATGAEPGTYTYSPNPNLGQITGDGVHTYGYDQRHRLSSIDAKTFKHSAAGVRSRSTSGNTTTEYFFSPEGSLIASSTGAASWIDYVWLGDLPIAQIPGGGLASIGNFLRAQKSSSDVQLTWAGGASSNLHVLRGIIGSWFTSQDLTPSGLSGTSYTDNGASLSGTNYWYKVMQSAPGFVQYVHTNPVGLPNRITNSSGVLIWQAEEFPFGDIYTQSGSSTTFLRFPGQYDKGGGVYQNRWRFYFPALGRYSQPDPFLAQNVSLGLFRTGRFPSNDSSLSDTRYSRGNTFEYARANPMRLTDPTGLVPSDTGGYADCVWGCFRDGVQRNWSRFKCCAPTAVAGGVTVGVAACGLVVAFEPYLLPALPPCALIAGGSTGVLGGGLCLLNLEITTAADAVGCLIGCAR